MNKLLLAPLLLALPLLAAGCLFQDDSNEEPQSTATPPARPAISRGSAAPTPTPQARATSPTNPRPARAPRDSEVFVTYSFPFIWPADGPITSFMGPEHPNGIDIGLDNSETLEVRAAARGTVIEAGGTDDDALGISIVLDHGNGVTTVYGHLSELFVAAGEQVETGQLIAIGGSTGIATGDHLHLEVRKDGATVDPMHVLPVELSETVALEVDCGSAPFTMPSGAQALFDFTPILFDGESIAEVEALSLSGGPGLDATVSGRGLVVVTSPVNFHGPEGLDSYELRVSLDSGAEDNVLNCAFAVEQEEVPTTFYVRADPPAGEEAEDGEAGEGVAVVEPTPVPDPTPTPWVETPGYQAPGFSGGSAQTPSYQAPGSTVGGAQSPSYESPGGGASGPSIQSPSYGFPTATPAAQ